MIIHEPALYSVPCWDCTEAPHVCTFVELVVGRFTHVWVSCWRPSGAHRNIIQMRTHMHNDRGCLPSGVLAHVCDPCVFFPRGSFFSWGGWNCRVYRPKPHLIGV